MTSFLDSPLLQKVFLVVCNDLHSIDASTKRDKWTPFRAHQLYGIKKVTDRSGDMMMGLRLISVSSEPCVQGLSRGCVLRGGKSRYQIR